MEHAQNEPVLPSQLSEENDEESKFDIEEDDDNIQDLQEPKNRIRAPGSNIAAAASSNPYDKLLTMNEKRIFRDNISLELTSMLKDPKAKEEMLNELLHASENTQNVQKTSITQFQKKSTQIISTPSKNFRSSVSAERIKRPPKSEDQLEAQYQKLAKQLNLKDSFAKNLETRNKIDPEAVFLHYKNKKEIIKYKKICAAYGIV